MTHTPIPPYFFPLMIGYMFFTTIMGGIVIAYLISVFRLLRHIRLHESDLWISLGKPNFCPFFEREALIRNIINPFQDLIAEARFGAWVRKNGPGAKDIKTRVLLCKSRKLCLFAGLTILLEFIMCLVMTIIYP
jgi:hypothetical protein